MTEPSPKRRRTSADPPEVSATGDFRPRNALRRTPPRRASWLSPTKASLARFNPEILSRRSSAASATAGPAIAADPSGRGQLARAYVLGESQQRPDADPLVPDEGKRRQSIGGRKLPRMDVLQAAGADVDRPEGDPTQEGSQRRQSMGGRSLPSRDVLQAAAADQQAQETTNAERRTSAEDDLPTHPAGSPAGRPDLPPQEGLFSSPSKRPKRNESLGQRLSSPFKPRESQLRMESLARQDDAGAETPTVKEVLPVERTPQMTEASGVERGPVAVVPTMLGADPRQEEKEQLQKQLQELQEEVKLYELEIERSRVAPTDYTEDVSSLISLVNKTNPSLDVKQHEAPPLSALLSAFLPLAKPVTLPTPPPDELEKPLLTHEPIELKDPLPYLQLFTSFNYKSKMDVVAKESAHQLHSISMHSPSSLLHLDFVMTADPSAQSVSKLEIQSVSPWASYELGTWITQRAAENDVGAVCWATESYYDLAIKRAKCWARCHREFGRLLSDALEAEVTQSGNKAPQGKRGQYHVSSSSNALEDEAEEVSGIGNDLTDKENDEHPISRAELLRGLGRESIVFKSKEVLFKVSWKIRFDWTGEAESAVGADVALPSVWREADDRGSFSKIPATFDKLLVEMGVFEAVRTMVGVLFA